LNLRDCGQPQEKLSVLRNAVRQSQKPWSIESRLCSSSKAAVGNDGRFVFI
jgi:hypothetical protein